MFPPPVIIDSAFLKSLEVRVNNILERHHQNKADLQGLLLLTAESVLLLNFAINRFLGANSSIGIGCTLLTLTALMLVYWAYSKYYINPEKFKVNPAGIKQLIIHHPDRWGRLNGNINLISEVENFIKNNIRLFKKEYVPYLHTTNLCLSAFTFGTPGIVVSSNIAALYEIKEFVDNIAVGHQRLIG